MQMLFKFQMNWIKIDDFRNWAYAELLVYVDLLAYVELFGRPNFTKLQCGTVTGSVALITENFRKIG